MATAESVTIAPPRPIEIIRPDSPKQGRYDAPISAMVASYASGDHFAATRWILEILSAIEADSRGPSPQSMGEITQAMNSVLTIIARPDYQIPESHSRNFLWHNPTIANAIATAGDNTTDAFVASLAGQNQEAFKSCVMLSARNNGDIRFDELFAAAPSLASAWLNETFKTTFSGNVNTRCRNKLISFARQVSGRYRYTKNVQEPYFLCTYLGDMEAERNLKSWINHAVKKTVPQIEGGKPSRTIAVVSDLWFEGHSVHRTLKAYIEALAADYRLILISTIRKPEDLDTSLFAESFKLDFDGELLNTDPLNNLGLAAVIYPDVGMTGSSILLSNMRIAPIQIMMTGHPVSTFGSEIDYFISGQLVENPEHQANYSELLVRLPGFGATHAKPTYEPQGTAKDFDGVLINASWYGQKVARPFLDLVNEAIGEAVADDGPKVKLQVFAGGAATNRGGFGAFLRDMGEAITACEVVVYPHLGYSEYMAQMERADFAIDCHPFAGSNTVSDNLWLRKPVIALEGDRWFNRIGPAMLRAVGLGGLVADTPEAFKNLIIDMIRYGHVCDAFAADLSMADLDANLYTATGAKEFGSWLDSVIRSTPAGLA